MKAWEWFCRLGTREERDVQPSLWRLQGVKARGETTAAEDGAAEFCTRLCGGGTCRCGSTVRGLHCIWSHYRKT